MQTTGVGGRSGHVLSQSRQDCSSPVTVLHQGTRCQASALAQKAPAGKAEPLPAALTAAALAASSVAGHPTPVCGSTASGCSTQPDLGDSSTCRDWYCRLCGVCTGGISGWKGYQIACWARGKLLSSINTWDLIPPSMALTTLVWFSVSVTLHGSHLLPVTVYLLLFRFDHPPISLVALPRAATESQGVSWLGSPLCVLARVGTA